MRRLALVAAAFMLFNRLVAQGFGLEEHPEQQRIDVLFNGHLLTSYCYPDSIRKPFLFPVNTTDGITVTRGYPVAPRAGERTDHPHHTGVWFNYESVNGLDFWNNSTAIPVDKRNLYGTIVHRKVIRKSAAGKKASLTIAASWITPNQQTLLEEETTFRFTVEDSSFFIDRETRLRADTVVVFADAKDGLLGIRVARELEQPSKEAGTFIDNKGNVTKVDSMNNDQVSGMYHSSEGLTGDSVWGTRGKWVTLTGSMHHRDITIGIIDHPSNPGYPAYWHARGYGLFAVNPLGQKIFSKGLQQLNLTLLKGQEVVFRYRIVIHSGSALTAAQMDRYRRNFIQTK